MNTYLDFLASKAPHPSAVGLDQVPQLAPHLFDYQRACVDFALRQGRSGLFLDTGLGKTLCELEFAGHAARETGRPSLILTPLAVARQIEREAVRFDYDAAVIRDGSDLGASQIAICNYDRLGRLDPAAFGAVVLDESSILKSFTGKTTRALIKAFVGHRFKLAATATPAPNDHMELGQQAEFLGVMSSMEMLSTFFINDTSTASQKWRLKRHAEGQFWDWIASWSRMAETPEDLGFDGARFALPSLEVKRHKTIGKAKPTSGGLFGDAVSATNLHEIKRQTSAERAAAVAEVVAAEPDQAWVIWCDTDYESAELKKAVPDAVEIRGSHKTEKKEEALAGFATGQVRIVITKPSITGYGVNWQHCARMVFVGRSFSYELWYQAVRRCWRFGQDKPVVVHLVVAEGEEQIGRVIDRKGADHAAMKAAMAQAMRCATGRGTAVKIPFVATHKGRLPKWLTV